MSSCFEIWGLSLSLSLKSVSRGKSEPVMRAENAVLKTKRSAKWQVFIHGKLIFFSGVGEGKGGGFRWGWDVGLMRIV